MTRSRTMSGAGFQLLLVLILLVLILLTQILPAAALAASAPPPVWPLDLDSRYLTGNFMEPRAGRFHTGLDLKTNSRTGYAVVAVQDGWISRLKCAATGYGKAIYLTSDDGTIHVYGHLARLRDDLRARVHDQQQRHGRYAVDITLPPGVVTVRRGEVLALSGQSATSGPHLHFEVRGADGQPRDPQAHGFAVPDTIAPEILAVRAVPLGTGAPSLVVGDGKTPLRGSLPELHLADGRVRFAARVVERSDHLRYRLGPWRLEVRRGDEPVLTAANDGLAWSQTRQQRLEYVRTGFGQERWLWHDPRGSLAGRWSGGWLEAPSLPPGSHRLQLVAEDRAGNRSSVTWTVVVGASEPGISSDIETSPGWRAAEVLSPEPWRLGVAGAVPREGNVRDPAPALAWRRGLADEPADDRWLRLAGLQPIGLPVQWRTDGRAILTARRIDWPALPVADEERLGDPTIGVYELDDGRWSYVGPIVDGGFDLDLPGVYGLLQDGAPPVVATASVTTELERRPVSRRHGISQPRWPLVTVPVGDHGSGIDWDRLAVKLDGAPFVAEPDAPRDRILVELPDDLPPGDHRLTIVATDQAGHETRVDLVLTLRAEADADTE